MTISDLLTIIIRMVIVVAIIGVFGILFSILSKSSLFRSVGSFFKYILLTVFNLFIIIVLASCLGIVTFIFIYIGSIYDLFITGDIYSIGVTKITALFVLIITSLFVISTLILARIPLKKGTFFTAAYGIVIGGTAILFPVFVQVFYPEITVSFIFSILLTVATTAFTFIFLFIKGKKDANAGYIKALQDKDTPIYRKKRKLEHAHRQRQFAKRRERNLRPAIFPWIYYRKKPEVVNEVN